MRIDRVFDIYSYIHKWQIDKNKGKVVPSITSSLSQLKGNKRENEIRKKVVDKKVLREELKSSFWYFKIKELSLHRCFFISKSYIREKPFKQFSEDVRLAYKYFIPLINAKEELEKLGISKEFLKMLHITSGLNPENNDLPGYSLLIEIKFRLIKPYLSKDDDDFYIIDNPIVKDKVFKVPMIRASTWKGVLRFISKELIEWSNENEKRAIIKRIFGHEKGEGTHFRQGRLFFYPTFFDCISLEVITPLSRESKTPVRGPIYFEIVPEESKGKRTEGVFRLLYYPFDLVAKGCFNEFKINSNAQESEKTEVQKDLEFLAKAIHKMFYEVGFSAKKTSGFGTAEVIDVKVLCGDKLKEYESPIQKIFEKLKESGS